MSDPAIAIITFLAILSVVILLFRTDKGWFWILQKRFNLSDQVLREDTLKYLAHCTLEGETANLKGISGSIKVDIGTATTIVSKLNKEGLLEIDGTDYKLSKDGMAYGLKMIRAHRLYETYLSEKTGYEDSEWHDRAERVEHRLSKEDIQDLEQELNYPVYDPHGDPIPTEDGKFSLPKNIINLSKLLVGSSGTIVHIEDEPKEIYSQLVAEGLYPGMEICITEIDQARIRFWSENDEHVLAPLLAANIQVVPKPTVKAKKTELPSAENQTIPKMADLGSVPPGITVLIKELSPRIKGTERRRLMDLGFLPGTKVKVEFTSASGDPIAFRIRDSLIALRSLQAKMVHTAPLPDSQTTSGESA